MGAVLDAAKSGDQRKALQALRDELAATFDAADVNMRPQISGQLRAILADLAALPPVGAVVTATDEIRARRERKSPPPATAARKRPAR